MNILVASPDPDAPQEEQEVEGRSSRRGAVLGTLSQELAQPTPQILQVLGMASSYISLYTKICLWPNLTLRNGGAAWWPKLELCNGGATWWPNLELCNGGATWWPNLELRNGGAAW